VSQGALRGNQTRYCCRRAWIERAFSSLLPAAESSYLVKWRFRINLTEAEPLHRYQHLVNQTLPVFQAP
jgi:hypothetical protein